MITFFFLKIEPAVAVSRLLRNILFFAKQPELVRQVFESVCAFVAAVPVFQLTFFPDEHVWDVEIIIVRLPEGSFPAAHGNRQLQCLNDP